MEATPHKHAKLSPSAAHRWTRCAGSVAIESTLPNKDTEYSIDGTITHALAEYCLFRHIWNPLKLVGEVLQLDKHTITVEMDRAERVRIYLDHLATLLLDPDYVMHAVESRLEIGHSLGIANCFGTSDFLGVVGTTLHVVDYKDGRGEIVHPDGNEQLILYAHGALSSLPRSMKISHVTLTIVQPKTQHKPESHTYTLPEFAEHVTRIRDAALLVTPDAPRTAGEKQCRFCKAKGICQENKDRAYEGAAQLFEGQVMPANNSDVQVINVHELTSDKLAQLLEMESFIRQTLDACAEEAVRRITSGGHVAGFKMVAGRNSRNWKPDATAEVLAKALHCSTDFFYEKKLKSVAGLEKELPAGGKKIIAEYVDKTEGAPTLAKESDKRAAIVYDAARLFDATAEPVDPTEFSFL